jgi:carbonic anhydrase
MLPIHRHDNTTLWYVLNNFFIHVVIKAGPNSQIVDRLLIYLMFEKFRPGLTAGLFGYVDPNGPRKWGSLSPKFAECSNGKYQAPVDIVKDQVVHNKSLKPLIRDYTPVNATLVNNGFNIEVCS